MKRPKIAGSRPSRQQRPAPVARTKRARREDDRSPLDFCAWCLRWMRRGADRRAIPLELNEAPVRGQYFVEIMIDGHLVLGIVPQPGSPSADRGAHLVVIVCGDTCADALHQGLRDDEARARGETPARREPTQRELRKAERLVSNVCAWCLTPIARNSPVVGVYATLQDSRARSDRAGGMISIRMAGRAVPGLLPEVGSPAALQGCDIGFMVCGEDCARALEAAAALDTSLSVVH